MKQKSRPYHHGDLRSALLEAAEKTLESGGGQELSLRELSREVGVSNTAPRRHFANKQAVLDALALQGFERLGAVLRRAVVDRTESFDVRIVKTARAYVRFALKHPALIRLMFAAKQHPSATPVLLEASQKALSAGLITVVEGQSTGAVVAGDPKRLALAVFAAAEGLVAISVHGQFDGVPLEKLVVDVVEQIILGLRPRP